MTAVRPVFDTNVLVSALLFHSGALSWLRGAWRSGRLRPLASRETTSELIRVLAYPKFVLEAHDQRELLDDYLPFCETVTVPHPPPPTPECRDPSDRPFLELAIAGSADALVTGDANIQMLAEVFAVPILSPAAFRRRFSYQEADVE
ncbi:MAG: putative toxin-antitoxin system toxin component, PIN family [Gammaproteobacteria bacterium]|nr:putative toxin-antitoxin system toxin component, PIN family [Gammaproteobacteria bacterium]